MTEIGIFAGMPKASKDITPDRDRRPLWRWNAWIDSGFMVDCLGSRICWSSNNLLHRLSNEV